MSQETITINKDSLLGKGGLIDSMIAVFRYLPMDEKTKLAAKINEFITSLEKKNG